MFTFFSISECHIRTFQQILLPFGRISSLKPSTHYESEIYESHAASSAVWKSCMNMKLL